MGTVAGAAELLPLQATLSHAAEVLAWSAEVVAAKTQVVVAAEILPELTGAYSIVGLAAAAVTMVPTPRPFDLVVSGASDLLAGTAEVASGVLASPRVARLPGPAVPMLPLHLMYCNSPMPIHHLPFQYTRSQHTIYASLAT